VPHCANENEALLIAWDGRLIAPEGEVDEGEAEWFWVPCGACWCLVAVVGPVQVLDTFDNHLNAEE
jgi:hypothetical protein